MAQNKETKLPLCKLDPNIHIGYSPFYHYIHSPTPWVMLINKTSETETIKVNDIRGLISRKVIQESKISATRDQAPATKSPPVPLKPGHASRVARALSVYNGWIPLDAWLNRSDTTWNHCNMIIRVLTDHQSQVMTYLTECDIPADMKHAGYMRGQIAAMEAICLLRQIYINVQQDIYLHPYDLTIDVTRFLRFVQITTDAPTVANDMFTIIQSVKSLDEFEMRWFSTFLPVNNLIHVRRIFKARVKRTVLHECLSVLHQRQWESNFGMYYFLGALSRLNGFDLHHPFWNEQTLRPVRHLFFLFSQVSDVDYEFARKVFTVLIAALHSRETSQIEGIYVQFIAWYFYKSSLKRKDITTVVETLSIWEKQLSISIKSNPRILTDLYHEMVDEDLDFAVKEIRNVIVIVDNSPKHEL